MNLATAASWDTTRASLTDGPLQEQSTNLVSNCSQRHKERAYIAASRRKDRSLEARFQSALQASKIHGSRTGKRLRVSKEVVANEEEYEEEEIQLHSHRATFPNIHAAPFHKSFNVVTKRGCKKRFPSDAEWRTNLVNKLFATYFPKFNCGEAQVDGNVSNLLGESMLTSRDMSWGDAEEQTTFNKERSHETCQPSHSLYNYQNWAALPSETDSTSNNPELSCSRRR